MSRTRADVPAPRPCARLPRGGPPEAALLAPGSTALARLAAVLLASCLPGCRASGSTALARLVAVLASCLPGCRAPSSTALARLAAVLLASCLPGCRNRPAATAADAGPAAATAALAQPLAAGPCDEAWRAAQVDVAFKEAPEDAAGHRTGPRLERRFTVARQLQGAYRHGDQWASVLEYEAGPVRGGVSYGLTVPDVLSGLEGQQVAWASHREAAGCLSGDGDGEHPALLAGDTLRDARGGLLLLTVPSAPTTPEGEVLLPPGLVPELRVRWEEAGCTQGPGTPSRGVRLRFEDARATGTVSASVGETRHLTLGDARYEVRVARARAEGAGRCGQAVFALFREGLRTQRRPE